MVDIIRSRDCPSEQGDRTDTAYLAPAVLKRLTCGREPSAVSLYDLCFLTGESWPEQVERVFD
jgi:hypothetical protein